MAQGSVLGPVHFLFYINELPKVSEILSCVLFADDTTLFLSEENCGNLVKVANAELGLISNWTKSNMLSLNVEYK